MHLFHEFTTDLPGEYQFILNNYNENEIKVTFAIHQGILNVKKHLSHKHLNQLYERLLKISSTVKHGRFNSQILNKRFDSRYESSKSHNRNIVLFSLIEIGLLCFIFYIQLSHIKSLAEKMNI